eukprot:403330676
MKDYNNLSVNITNPFPQQTLLQSQNISENNVQNINEQNAINFVGYDRASERLKLNSKDSIKVIKSQKKSNNAKFEVINSVKHESNTDNLSEISDNQTQSNQAAYKPYPVKLNSRSMIDLPPPNHLSIKKQQFRDNSNNITIENVNDDDFCYSEISMARRMNPSHTIQIKKPNTRSILYSQSNRYARDLIRRDRRGIEIKKGSKMFHVYFRDQIPTEDFTQDNSEILTTLQQVNNDDNGNQSFDGFNNILDTQQQKEEQLEILEKIAQIDKFKSQKPQYIVLPLHDTEDIMMQHYSDLLMIEDLQKQKNSSSMSNIKIEEEPQQSQLLTQQSSTVQDVVNQQQPSCKCTCAVFGVQDLQNQIPQETEAQQSNLNMYKQMSDPQQNLNNIQQKDQHHDSAQTILDQQDDISHKFSHSNLSNMIITGDFNEEERRGKTPTIRQPLYEVIMVESYKTYNKKPAPWHNEACCLLF